MFSSLPNLADRAFIVGFLVPSLILLLVLAWLFSDIPVMQSVLNAAGGGGLESVLFAAAFVWFVAIGLMMLNRPLLQLLEGYYGPFATGSRKAAAKAEFAALKGRLEEMRSAWKQAGDAYPEALQDEHDALLEKLASRYPSEARLVLPTRFGNVVRSFEDYSRAMYGADSIPLWPHLVSVTPEAFLAVIEDARSQVNCAANVAMIGVLVAAVSLGRLAFSDASFVDFQADAARFVLVNSANYTLLFVALGALLVTWGAYEMAVERAQAWGGLVKAAFDCYLPKLGKELGFLPTGNNADQKAFWEAASRRVIFRRPISNKQWQIFGKGPPKPPFDELV